MRTIYRCPYRSIPRSSRPFIVVKGNGSQYISRKTVRHLSRIRNFFSSSRIFSYEIDIIQIYVETDILFACIVQWIRSSGITTKLRYFQSCFITSCVSLFLFINFFRGITLILYTLLLYSIIMHFKIMHLLNNED